MLPGLTEMVDGDDLREKFSKPLLILSNLFPDRWQVTFHVTRPVYVRRACILKSFWRLFSNNTSGLSVVQFAAEIEITNHAQLFGQAVHVVYLIIC